MLGLLCSVLYCRHFLCFSYVTLFSFRAYVLDVTNDTSYDYLNEMLVLSDFICVSKQDLVLIEIVNELVGVLAKPEFPITPPNT